MALARGIIDFYALRLYAPAWSAPSRLDALIDALRNLALDGLNPEDYNASALEQARMAPSPTGDEGSAQRADLDLLATQSYLLALLHLYRGKVDPSHLHIRWNFEPREFDLEFGLSTAVEAVDYGQIADVFDLARPDHPVYAGLRAGLARLREVSAQGGWPQLADGPSLRPGMSDPRVKALRRRLSLAGYLPQDDGDGDRELYDAGLEQAVKRFQEEQYLEADGAVGRSTRRALNVPVGARINQLRVNLERARWLLPRIKGDLVLVDVAGYKVRYYHEGKVAWMSRVQVGREARRTPIFKASITFITFNPTWTVPSTILREDVLPKVRRDAAYLARNRIRVLDARGREISADRVDWDHPGNVLLRQDPGPGNSLGRVRINFPNPYDIFLHETPHTELFDKGARPFSSGCIRVEYPFELAEILLNDPENWNRAAIDRVVAAGKTLDVPLSRPVPVMVLYWTLDLHQDGRIAYKPDIYQLDVPTFLTLDQGPAGK